VIKSSSLVKNESQKQNEQIKISYKRHGWPGKKKEGKKLGIKNHFVSEARILIYWSSESQTVNCWHSDFFYWRLDSFGLRVSWKNACARIFKQGARTPWILPFYTPVILQISTTQHKKMTIKWKWWNFLRFIHWVTYLIALPPDLYIFSLITVLLSLILECGPGLGRSTIKTQIPHFSCEDRWLSNLYTFTVYIQYIYIKITWTLYLHYIPIWNNL